MATAAATPRLRLLRKCSLTPEKTEEEKHNDGSSTASGSKTAALQKVTPVAPADVPGASELRALFPRIWRHFRSRNRHAIHRRRSKASTTVAQLRSWLQSLPSSVSRWGYQPEDKLRAALKGAEEMSQLRQRLGFRFQDPTGSGTWAASNLVGYSESAVGKKKVSDVSWDSYTAFFRLRLADGKIELERSLVLKPVVARVEKRKRGDPKGPLARESMLVTAASRRLQASDKRKRIRVERRQCDFLPAVMIRPPVGPQQWTLIYLHGLGSSALANYADRPHYFFDGSIQLKVVVPTAPSREVSCYDTWWTKSGKNKSWRLTKFLSWYDYLSNYDGAREDHIDWESLGTVQRALHSLIQREAQELGGNTQRVILGGKSQGCCTALDAALTYPKPLGGFIGVVGHLLSCTPVEAAGPQCQTPLHFFHEPEDRIMRWEWVRKGEQRLREVGYNVRSRRMADPEKHGHFVEGVEGAWVRTALRSICCDKSSEV